MESLSHSFCSAGLVHEDCITKMRLMSLLDLSSHESGEIPYSLIRDTLRVIKLFVSPVILAQCLITAVLRGCNYLLQITDDEVEYWVVKAITSKQLDCKMDQLNQVVIVRFTSNETYFKTFSEMVE